MMERKILCPSLKTILPYGILIMLTISFYMYVYFVTSFHSTAFASKPMEVINLNSRLYNDKRIDYDNKTHRHGFHQVIGTQENGEKNTSDINVIPNKNACFGVDKLFISVLIHSAIANFERRRFIRNTWGNTSLVECHKMRLWFLLGKPVKRQHQTAINLESEQYNDIVQGPFIDTYQNLTYKALLGLRWVTDNCGQANFVLKVDDDVIVNTSELLNLLASKYANVNHTIFCAEVRQNGTSKILRGGKNRVENAQFPNITHWPVTYCPGRYLIYTAGVINQLMAVVNQTQFVWLDDVYVTGFLASKVGHIKLVSAKDISKQFKWLENAKTGRLQSEWNRFARE